VSTAFSSTATRRRFRTTPAFGLALLLTLGLTGCGGGDDNDASLPRTSTSPTTRSAVIAGPTSSTPAPETTTPLPTLPTLPPGDPGDVPSEPEDTSNVEEPRDQALTKVPQGALLDAKTVGEVLGGSWTSSAAPADSCAAPRPTRAVATRSTALTGSGGGLVETISTYNGTAGTTAISNLAKRLRGCGWTQEAEPPLGAHSAELSRKGSSGVERVVVVESEGVAVTVVGRGQAAANSDDWAAIVDVAIGTSCLAAPDGCH
jgi:hypothetical protein